jgi:hypothetical protein
MTTRSLKLAGAVALLTLLAACGPTTTNGPGAASALQTSRPSGTGPGTPGDVSADRFKGQTGKEILTALGEPSFRRREPPAEVWQYYGQGCVLDLFLYDETGGQRVTHAELRSRNFNADPAPDCLPLLLQGKRQPMS